MPGSGTGTYVGPPVSTGFSYTPANAVTLPRYAEIVGADECALYGIAYSGQTQYACRTIWTKAERDMIEFYLASAQTEIEDVLNYPLVPTWYADEEHRYTYPVLTDFGYLLEVGIQAVSNIAVGTPVSHAADPAVIGPLATTLTDMSEVHVFFEDTDIEIPPSSIVLSGGFISIYIPRCRMVIPAIESQQPKAGWDYTDTGPSGPFAQNVDVKRVYTDTSTQAVLTRKGDCSSAPCEEIEDTACGLIQNQKTGSILATPATWSGSAWVRSSPCYQYSKARLNYKAGLTRLPRVLEDAVVRLAHSRMPTQPCGCEAIMHVWKRDRDVPTVLTRDRIDCPFGISAGAWTAWTIAKKHRLMRAGVL